MPLLRIIRDRHELPRLLGELGLGDSGAELGVWKGSFSRRLLGELPRLRLNLVDIWAPVDIYTDGTAQDAAFAEAVASVAPFGGRATFIRNWTAAAAAMVPDGSLDFVYDHRRRNL